MAHTTPQHRSSCAGGKPEGWHVPPQKRSGTNPKHHARSRRATATAQGRTGADQGPAQATALG